jgi:HK97 family phage portal protein
VIAVGIFDWLGPLNTAGKARGWDALPPSTPERRETAGLLAERKSALTDPSMPGPLVVNGTPSFWTPTSAISLVTPAAADGNSAVFACLQAIAVAVAEPPLRVYRVAPGERIEQERTPLGDLLDRPNPHMTTDVLLSYTAVSLHVEGNAYWRKLRAGNPESGNVVELWPISPSRMEPITRNGSGDFISFYRYTSASGRVEDIPTENVVHFRYGIDDDDHRVGLAPLKRLLREISSDQQATRYADRLLANLAINGLALTFDKETAQFSQADADQMKARIQAAYGGDNIGSVAVVGPGGKLEALGFSPEQMDLKVLHRVPEERISAVLGVPAIVAGLGAGLDRSTYSNFSEAREAFTETKLLPLWRSLAGTLQLQLVRDFTSDRAIVVDFDTDEVRALSTDLDAQATRLQGLVASGILTTDEARAELGYEPLPSSELRVASSEAEVPAQLRAASRSRPNVTRFRPAESDPLSAGTSRKAAEDLPGRYADLADASLPTWEDELIAFLDGQQRRITRRLRAGADTASDLVTEGEAVLLGETLTPLQLRVLGEVQRLVVSELGVAFELPNPAVEEALRLAAGNISGITETTRASVQEALVAGQQAGEGVESIARRLRDLPAFNPPRARVVARTELANTTNISALTSYRESGVVLGVRVLDGDADAACAAMNGRVFRLDQPPAALEHPSCTRAFAPLTDAAELTRSA